MAIKDYVPLNFAIMGNGFNWIILTLMIVVAGMMLALLFPTVATPDGSK